MTDLVEYSAEGIRTIEQYGNRSPLRARRPLRSRIYADPGVAPPLISPSGFTIDNGLVLSLYNPPDDAQPADSAHNEGGALILHAQIELVFWGTAWQTAADPSVTDIIDAVKGILASPYLLGLAEYGLQDAALRGTTVIDTDPPQNFSYNDPGNLVLSLIDDGQFPDPDGDGGRILYMVFMPPGANAPLVPGKTFPPGGAHSDPEDSDFLDPDYAWVGWVRYGELDFITKVFSHELVETITDPESHDRAWVMDREINGGKEIGDACDHSVDTVNGITVQAYWSERHKACVLPKGHGPLPSLRDFSQGVRVQAGTAGSTVISLDGETPIDLPVSLFSDSPDVLSVPAMVVIPAGGTGGLVRLQAETVPGGIQYVTIHASLGAAIVSTQVEVTPHPSVIAGVVRDTASNPIPQADITINDGTVVGAETGSDGTYATPVLPPGTYKVAVMTPNAEFVPQETTVVIQEGVPVAEVDFTLDVRLSFTVAGTVTNSRGAPIAGAAVVLMQQDWYEHLDGVTDNAGGYSLSMNPQTYIGRYWLKVSAPGYADGFLDLAIPNGANLREDFILPNLGVVTGRVLDGSTTPVAGALVKATLSGNDPLAESTVSVVSDSAGRYQLLLPPGPTAIAVQAHGFYPYSTTVPVVSGGTVNSDFSLDAATAALNISVSDDQNQGLIGNAHIQVGSEFAGPPGPDGRYLVSEIPAGTHKVEIHADRYEPQITYLEFVDHQTITMDYFLEPVSPGPPHMYRPRLARAGGIVRRSAYPRRGR